METSQILKTLPVMLFLALCNLPYLSAKPLLFRQAVDTEFPNGPLGHLMDLSGAWSLALSSSADTELESKAFMANAIIPFSSNPENLFHGYFLSPTYFQSEGRDDNRPTTLGNTGWQLMLGRGNLDFPRSIFRGYLMMGYRELALSNDAATERIQNAYALSGSAEKKRSVIISTGVSSTQNSLVSQKKPLVDSELLVTLRYDYEKGDFYTLAKAALFYPTWLDFGANIAWYKAFRETENPLFNEVSDDFIFGPRVRGRAWNHLAFDAALEWHAYRDFSGDINIPGPRAVASIIANF